MIERSSRERPFFIYLSLFTKSYPREVQDRRGGSMEKAMQVKSTVF